MLMGSGASTTSNTKRPLPLPRSPFSSSSSPSLNILSRLSPTSQLNQMDELFTADVNINNPHSPARLLLHSYENNNSNNSNNNTNNINNNSNTSNSTSASTHNANNSASTNNNGYTDNDSNANSDTDNNNNNNNASTTHSHSRNKGNSNSNINSNCFCFDCGEQSPEWASLGFGVFVCLDCAGHHRSLGVHITMVRAVKLDVWSEEQLLCMQCGGNERFEEYLKEVVSSSNLKLRHNQHQPNHHQRHNQHHEPNPQQLLLKEKHNFKKYGLPKVLYYSEILKATIEKREPITYDEDHWSRLIKAPSTSGTKQIPKWTADNADKHCMLCKTAFSFVNRRHHCRRCGKLVCNSCAPKENTRPIMEWGMKEPVRHCKECYRSPALNWKS